MGFAIQTIEETSQAATRQHLLEAAAEVFSETGYRSATVRQICERAGANIAAVNYHFGDKEALYRAVLRASFKTALDVHPAKAGPKAKATPEARLEQFIRAFLQRIFSKGPLARHGKLMAREMIEPTSALDEIIQGDIRPRSQELSAILKELIGPKAAPNHIQLCAMSVVSQVLFYHHCRPVVERLDPKMKFDAVTVEYLTRHITDFSLAAILEMKRKSAK